MLMKWLGLILKTGFNISAAVTFIYLFVLAFDHWKINGTFLERINPFGGQYLRPFLIWLFVSIGFALSYWCINKLASRSQKRLD